jgi:hypothetical protein
MTANTTETAAKRWFMILANLLRECQPLEVAESAQAGEAVEPTAWETTEDVFEGEEIS